MADSSRKTQLVRVPEVLVAEALDAWPEILELFHGVQEHAPSKSPAAAVRLVLIEALKEMKRLESLHGDNKEARREEIRRNRSLFVTGLAGAVAASETKRPKK